MSPSAQPNPTARSPYLAPQLERLGGWNWIVGCSIDGVISVCRVGQSSLFDLEQRK